MNGFDILLLLLVAAAVVLAIRTIHKDRKNGKSCLGCSGSCSGCTSGCSKCKTPDKNKIR